MTFDFLIYLINLGVFKNNVALLFQFIIFIFNNINFFHAWYYISYIF